MYVCLDLFKINNIPIESGTGFIGDNSIDYKDRLTDLKTYVKCSEEDSCNLGIPNTIKNNFSKIKEYITYHITYPVNSKNINANGYTNITTDDPENTGSYYFFGDEIIFVNNSLSFITDLLNGNTINRINYNIVEKNSKNYNIFKHLALENLKHNLNIIKSW